MKQEQQEEKLYVCPKAKECDKVCTHNIPHKLFHGDDEKDISCNARIEDCPACIPVEPEPKPEGEHKRYDIMGELCREIFGITMKPGICIEKGKPIWGGPGCKNIDGECPLYKKAKKIMDESKTAKQPEQKKCCRKCGGTGKILNIKCWVCKGTGLKPSEK